MIDPEQLQGRWVHSHEEDTEDEIVYRAESSGYDFPRSRGREALELHPDGSYSGVGAGADGQAGGDRRGDVVGGGRQARAARPDARGHGCGGGGAASQAAAVSGANVNGGW